MVTSRTHHTVWQRKSCHSHNLVCCTDSTTGLEWSSSSSTLLGCQSIRAWGCQSHQNPHPDGGDAGDAQESLWSIPLLPQGCQRASHDSWGTWGEGSETIHYIAAVTGSAKQVNDYLKKMLVSFFPLQEWCFWPPCYAEQNIPERWPHCVPSSIEPGGSFWGITFLKMKGFPNGQDTPGCKEDWWV